MLLIDDEGWVVNPRVELMRRPKLAHGKMSHISGIIVHQTGARTAQSTLNSYLQAKANGAHFLIDKDGKIYQTSSVFSRTYHVGQLQPRCLAEMTCPPVEARALAKMGYRQIHHHEMAKAIPKRYPSNDDSIGIELVAGTIGNEKEPPYEAATPQQNSSLAWLIGELRQNFRVPLNEIFRHPQVSYKDRHEAESARW